MRRMCKLCRAFIDGAACTCLVVVFISFFIWAAQYNDTAHGSARDHGSHEHATVVSSIDAPVSCLRCVHQSSQAGLRL